jgi:2-polyprenyl-6-methoxyphenol hydroxylase-like FAD-dependent oxidoreductase
MRYIIVGGGIGGMAAAIALRNVGQEPVVLEQAPEANPVGAGVSITANGMKALTYLGADEHIRDVSVSTDEMVILDLETDTTLTRIEFGSVGQERYGDGSYQVYRPDLHEALAGATGPGDLRRGAKVQDIELGANRVTAILEGGERVTADGLIAADGLGSRTRTANVDDALPQYTGFTGWRTVISQADAPELFPTAAVLRSWIAPRRQVVTYPVRTGLLNVLAYLPVEVAGPESWTAPGDPDVLRAAFGSACGAVKDILAAVDGGLLLTPIHYRRPLASWGSGPMTLLGDAAHASVPHAAQGSSMALEDAVMLGAMAKRFAADGVERVFREYEARRIPRTTKALVMALNNLVYFTESDPDVLRTRQQQAQGQQQVDPINERTWGWLYHYDVAAAADRPTPLQHGLVYPRFEETDRLTEGWLSA